MPEAIPADDLVHEPEPNAGWRESYAFEFYDERLGLGVWHSIGKKPFKGYSGFTVGIWGAELLTGVGLDRFTAHTEEHRVEGMRYECILPLEKWRLTFDGHLDRHTAALRLDPKTFARAGAPDLPKVPVQFDLTFTANVPAYRYRERKEWSPIFTGHLDGTGRTVGTLVIDGRTYEIDGWGIRDRSWGTRDWTWPLRWRFAGVAGPDFNLVLWYAEADGGLMLADGYAQMGPDRFEVVSYQERLKTEPAPGKPIPRSFESVVGLQDGRHIVLTGEVLQSMPVLFEKVRNGQTVRSWNDRSLVRYRLPDGATAYGSLEIAERLTGEPASI